MIRKKVFSTTRYILLIIISILSIFPIYFMVNAATNSSGAILMGKMTPGSELLTNLRNLVDTTIFVQAAKNSLTYAIVGTLVSIIVNSIAGYGFEIYHDRAKDRTMGTLLLSMMVPGAATLIPMYTMFARLGLLNTMVGYLGPMMASAFTIMLFRQNAKAFPREIIEAARIDGLGEVAIYVSMYVPNMKATYATATIITFTHLWNDYLWALVMLQDPNRKILPILLSDLTSAYTVDYGMVMTLATLITLPLAIIFMTLQKYYTQGLTGSTKG